MSRTELRAKIIDYLEQRDGGDLLRSVGMIAEAVGAERTEVQDLVRDMVKKGEVFEPIPRRYLRRERRFSSERRVAARGAAGDSERRRTSRRAGARG